MTRIRKYPRTHHIEGSRLQPGDEDLSAVPLARFRGQTLVVEEKIDGANSAVSFDHDGELLLQSRGHYLTGGHHERHFALFKSWAQAHRHWLFELLGDRFVMYGEWVYAKHTIYYDALPHYFLEFDILDRQTETFLSTDRRHEMLAGRPIVSVPVLAESTFDSTEEMSALIQNALFKSSDWKQSLREAAAEAGTDVDRAVAESDSSDLAEGLYIKLEEDGEVTDRLKFIRRSFLTTVLAADDHWLDRGIIPNRLLPDVDLFESAT